MTSQPLTLDREAYARARAMGLPRHECARRAGSQATSDQSLCNRAAELEGEPEVQAMIEAERARRADQIESAWDTAWDLARVAIVSVLQDSERPSLRLKAAELVAKLRGEFAPDRHQVEQIGAYASRSALEPLIGDTEIGRRALDRLEEVTHGKPQEPDDD